MCVIKGRGEMRGVEPPSSANASAGIVRGWEQTGVLGVTFSGEFAESSSLLRRQRRQSEATLLTPGLQAPDAPVQLGYGTSMAYLLDMCNVRAGRPSNPVGVDCRKRKGRLDSADSTGGARAASAARILFPHHVRIEHERCRLRDSIHQAFRNSVGRVCRLSKG